MIEVTAFKSINGTGALRGTLTLKINTEYGVLIIRGCKFFEKGENRWVAFPQREYKTKDGKTQYIGHMFIEEKEYRELFSKNAVEGLDFYLNTKSEVAKEVKKQNEINELPYNEDMPF